MGKCTYEYGISVDEYKEWLSEQPVGIERSKSKVVSFKKNRAKAKMTDPHIAKRMKKLSPNIYGLYKRYRKEVDRLTNLQPLHTLRHFEKRGFRSWHVDHKVSVWHGFKNGIHPASIAHISNLQICPSEKNMEKGHKSEGQMIIL